MWAPAYRELTKAYDRQDWALFRGQTVDGQRVVIKAVKPGPTRDRSVAQLRNQLELLSSLDVPGIVRALGFDEDVEGMPALILEDAGPESLESRLRARRLSLEEFLELAIGITEIVGQLHARNVIHRDLTPSNIVLDGNQLTLIDFDLAASVAGLAQPTALAGELADSLPYIAPEQTGRTDRFVDHRADLYSLGAMFHQMLTGMPPFRATDVVELVHAQLAAPSVPPTHIDSTIPSLLSDIVVKLLAKTPEDRYQSAEALVADLAEAKRRLHESKAIGPFELGRLDLARTLPLPERLYGREAEQAALVGALERVFGGARELVLLSGVAGIGNTALVEDLHDCLGRALLVSGKCDQIRSNVPYSGFVSACRSVTQTLLAQPDEEVAQWRQRLVAALAPNARVITELIPDLERLIGPQPPVAALGPLEVEKRLHLTFQAFVRNVAGPDRPLAIFLDDLQWADPASLKLLRAIALDREITHLLFIGAFRSVGPEHQLAEEIHAIEKAGAAVRLIELGPLPVDVVTRLLRDALRCNVERGRPLAELVMLKTAGNPFFIRRLLRFLQQNRLLFFDAAVGRWEWELERIDAVGITDNVVELLVDAVQRLPAETSAVLKVAACIGHRFDLTLLASVHGSSVEEAGRRLSPAVREGLLVPVRPDQDRKAEACTSVDHAFAHDRVQQAVYSLIGDEEQQRLHLNIGRRLRHSLSATEVENRLFEVVDQLDLGAVQMADVGEQLELVRLNERAGRKARAAAAFEPALRYFRWAIELLMPNGWASARALAFRVHRDAAECAFLLDRQPLAEELADTALVHAATHLEKGEIYRLRVIACNTRGAWAEAIRWGREGLRILGLELPERDLEGAIAAQTAALQTEIGNRSPAELLALPEVQDEQAAALIHFLNELTFPSFLTTPALLTLVSINIVRLSLRHGHAVSSALGFADYAMVLARESQYDLAYTLGTLALDLARHFLNPNEECKVLFIFGSDVNLWRAPFRSAIPLTRVAIVRAMESGSLLPSIGS